MITAGLRFHDAASTAKDSPLTRPAVMQARTTASKTWRNRSLSLNRPCRKRTSSAIHSVAGMSCVSLFERKRPRPRYWCRSGFATKPQIARKMIARAIAAKIPFCFVAADSVYGTGEIETALRKAGKGYVLGIAANHVFRSWGKKQLVGGTAAKIAQNLPESVWRRLSAGEGTKGPRLHDWAYLELADLDAGEYNSTLSGEWTRGLLIRRNIADGDLAFFSTWCPKGTSIKKLVSVEGHRWGHRGQLRDRQERTRPRSQRNPLLA